MRPRFPWFAQMKPPLRNPAVWLENLTWPEVQAMLDSGMDTLLLPVGALEQHGPHLPLNTDTVIAIAACAYASALTGVPVLPAVSIGVSLGHSDKWPGTFSISHQTLIQTICEIARWSQRTGWKRLIIVNSHCGNDAALRVAVDQLRTDLRGHFLTAVRNTWALTAEISACFTQDATDWHANKAETDLMLVIAPESVRLDQLASADDPDRTQGCVFPWTVPDTSRNGVTGEPSRASFSDGQYLLQLIGTALAELVSNARTEIPPLPATAS